MDTILNGAEFHVNVIPQANLFPSISDQDLPFLETTPLFKQFISSEKAKLNSLCSSNIVNQTKSSFKLLNKQTARKSFKLSSLATKNAKEYIDINDAILSSKEVNFISNACASHNKPNDLQSLIQENAGHLNAVNSSSSNSLLQVDQKETYDDALFCKSINNKMQNSFEDKLEHSISKQEKDNQLLIESSVAEVIEQMIETVIKCDLSKASLVHHVNN